MQIKLLKKTAFILGLLSIVIITNACDYDDKVSITEPARYTNDNVKSYADLFTIFWTVMDQRYSCFYEQKIRTDMDWDAVYDEYYPKFSALNTFGRSTDDSNQIDTDRENATEYFKNIIDPIIDRHFFVKIYMPFDNNGRAIAKPFYGGIKHKSANEYDFKAKLGYIENWLTDDITAQTYKPRKTNGANGNTDSFTYLTGRIKSNPEICYLTYDKFSVFLSNIKPYLNLSPSQNQNPVLRVSDIENHPELNAISNVNLRNKVKALSILILNQWDSFGTSPEINTFRTQINQFIATEEMSDAFVNTAKSIASKLNNVVDFLDYKNYVSVLTPETVSYFEWFIMQMKLHTNDGYDLKRARTAALAVIEKAPFYQSFLNPLHKGEIKKLIFDLRGNGGGHVVDFQFFIERFVTKSAIWSYEKTKEGNGRFDYTPWVPQKTKPHPFGIPATIPIAILTDKGSVSMSEASTLVMKSQGPQVVSIGDYSYGGLATVFNSQDDFHSGIVGNVTDWVYFYMPVSSTKGSNGEMIEGVGIKPDIYVSPPTDTELEQMENTPDTFVDRVMEAAVNYLSSK